MVGSSHIDLHALTLDEVTGVVNLYPWYAAARMELCRRMFAMGEAAWSEDEFATQALYVADRSKFSELIRGGRSVDCADKDAARLLASYMEPAVSETGSGGGHQVHVVGGDYFSQAQYDQVRSNGDNIFTRFAGLSRSDSSSDAQEVSEIADRFATETLARIFVEQGRNEEARRIYSRLILDIPEKSAYFASLIDELD